MGVRLNISIILLGIFFYWIFLVRREQTSNVLEGLKRDGYEGELHHATTEDGYILGLQRIIRGPHHRIENHFDVKDKKEPVLIIHGLESSAIDWINHLGKDSLPYILFEEGYDVWLGNVRGTYSSYNHTILDRYNDAKTFWDTSIHEIGYYDLPAMIDYVLGITKKKKIFYLGMSQGEATFLIMASTRPQYNSKIHLASLTSPSSHLKHSDNSFMKFLGKYWALLQYLGEMASINQVPGRDMVGTFCRYSIFSRGCRLISHNLIGYADIEQTDLETYTRLFEIYPSRSALKQLIHYLQMYNSGIFRRFDYGEEENFRRYSSKVPPPYNLAEITAPVAYFWGENDCWSRPKDIEDVMNKLPNVILNYKVPDPLFNHFDLMVAKNAKRLVYSKITETLRKFERKEND